jgi:hypothetical protein
MNPLQIHYELANLIPLLERIREPGRYAGMNGVNALTNATFGSDYRKDEVVRALRGAVEAGRAKDDGFAPAFTDPKQGLSHGLNPYCDWSLGLLDTKPDHAYLFLGLDWYSISGLGHTEDWFDYLANPFADVADLYWHRLWAWLLRKYKKGASDKLNWDVPVREPDAAALVRADGGAFIFHNRVPYLRPAGHSSSNSDWYEKEWKKPSVRESVVEDLGLLRELMHGQIVAFCTSRDSEIALLEAGYERRRVLSWRAHPSKVFHPQRFVDEDLWFRGIEHFAR